MNAALSRSCCLPRSVPLLVIYFWRGRSSALGGAVRDRAMLVLLALVAAVPLAPLGGKGVDVVIVADLSRSMPADSRARALEIVKLLEQQRARAIASAS